MKNRCDSRIKKSLVRAVLGASEYAYDFDSIGNRLSSSEAGTQLAYASNALNQYVSMGKRRPRRFRPTRERRKTPFRQPTTWTAT